MRRCQLSFMIISLNFIHNKLASGYTRDDKLRCASRDDFESHHVLEAAVKTENDTQMEFSGN